MVGAVGEMASMKRRKLWKTGEDGLCCSSSAIQTRLGPSSLLEERSEITNVFVVSFVLSATPKLGETAKVYRYIPLCFYVPHAYVQVCTAVVVDDHCLVPSLGIPAVWLGSLLALSLQCPGHLAAVI